MVGGCLHQEEIVTVVFQSTGFNVSNNSENVFYMSLQYPILSPTAKVV